MTDTTPPPTCSPGGAADVNATRTDSPVLERASAPSFGGEGLRLPAIRYFQGGRPMYAIVGPGEQLHRVLAVSRIRREGDQVAGYQRPEVLRHIAEIRGYVERADALLPNALVVAFDARVRFEGGVGGAGEIVIPEDRDHPAGWVVDGQQRLAALTAAARPDFDVCVVGFIARDDVEAAEQFVLVNATKPLPRALLHELLPVTGGVLPRHLEARRISATLLDQVQRDPASPFFNRIQTMTHRDGEIRDTSVLAMITNSLGDGTLYTWRASAGGGEPDYDAMAAHLALFWGAVARQWPEAWARPPRASRLTHGAGVVALGFVMDAMGNRVDEIPAALRRLAPHCAWTDGQWALSDDDVRPWNGIQNTQQDIQVLARHLMRWLRHPQAM